MAGAWDRVTPREREVLRLLLDLRSVSETAQHLGISRASVQRHAKNALAKLQGDMEARPVNTPTATALGWSPDDFMKGLRALMRLQKRHGIPWSLVVVAYEGGVDAHDLARELATLVRVSDRIGWGKNCLWLVLPATTRTGAGRLAERIRTLWEGRGTVGIAWVEANAWETPERTLERGQVAAQRALIEEEAWRRVGRG